MSLAKQESGGRCDDSNRGSKAWAAMTVTTITTTGRRFLRPFQIVVVAAVVSLFNRGWSFRYDCRCWSHAWLYATALCCRCGFNAYFHWGRNPCYGSTQTRSQRNKHGRCYRSGLWGRHGAGLYCRWTRTAGIGRRNRDRFSCRRHQ